MNWIRTTIKPRYSSITSLLMLHGTLVIFMTFMYRVRVYALIADIYPDLKLNGFFEYLSLSLHHDSILIVIAILIVFLVALALAGSRRALYVTLTSISILFILFILSSIEFFRIYQTTFQSNFAGREHFSGLGNMLDSAKTEFSGGFFFLFFLLSAVSAASHAFLYYREHIGSRAREKRTGLPASVASLSIPGMALFFVLAGVSTDASIPLRQFADRYKASQVSRNISILNELAANPVLNLFASRPAEPDRQAPSTSAPQKQFRFRLNTASLETDTHYGRIRSIPFKKRYNIILYFFESTPRKYYDMKINGRYVIETWHRLEKNSLNFLNHYANYPLSANALLTVLTSAYDLNSKDMVIQKYPDIPLRTLSEILKEQGYRTCLIHTGGLGYAGQKRFLKNRKFDEIVEYDDLVSTPPYNRQVGWGVDERAMIKPAIRFISKKPGSPYFMVFLPVNPHHPYACAADSFRIAGHAEGKKKTWVNYLNSLHYADASLGMLVDELDRAGCLDNTLFFLFADHGEAFYQHTMNYNHPLFLYNENVHVPFLIYNRELFETPEYFEGITRHIDILPTILDIQGIALRPEQEGISVLSEHYEQMALLHTSWKDDYMGVVDQRWKYIYRTGDGMEELYDLETDPDEKKNIASDRAAVSKRYREFIVKSRAYKDVYYNRILGR